MACSSTPSPAKKLIVHELHGDRRDDDYHWMKDTSRTSPEVLKHLASENLYTDRVLEPTLATQKQLVKEFRSRMKAEDTEVPAFDKGYFYYSKTIEGGDYEIYCRRKGSMEAPEEVLLDLNEFSKGRSNITLGALHVSPDQSTLAFTIDENGSEKFSLFLKDLNSNAKPNEAIQNMEATFVWAADSRTLFFTRVNEAWRPDKVFRFRLGDTKEVLVFEEKDPLYELWVRATQDEKFLLMGANSFNGDEVYFLDSQKPASPWQVIQKRDGKLEYSVEHNNGYFYILNNSNALNFKISRTKVSQPSLRHWKDYVAHNKDRLLSQVLMLESHLIYLSREDVNLQMRFVKIADNKQGKVALPGKIFDVSYGENPEFKSDHVQLKWETPLSPAIVYDFNFKDGSLDRKKEKEVPNFDPSLYEVKRIFVQARDGAEVPVTLLYKKGFKKDGKAPALLYGYGAYGNDYEMDFDSEIFSLLDRGFLVAQAHIRGSQAKGRDWYEKGRMSYKMNTFTDFVDVARGLIGSGYTSSKKLAAYGRSAGGLLMGAITNMRPDLFKAVVAGVPFVDVLSTMLDTNLRYSTQEFAQWGDPTDPIGYRQMRAYSPYDNIKDQSFPSVYAFSGLHDTRVNYWEPAKWIAKLREYNQSDSKMLLRTQMNSGHTGSGGRYGKLEEKAEMYGFILQALGEIE